MGQVYSGFITGNPGFRASAGEDELNMNLVTLSSDQMTTGRETRTDYYYNEW